MNGDRWVELPQHLEDVPNGRRATAPYNFVPLPETVVRAYQTADELPSHDRYDPERKTGWIDVTLRARSPLFIRSAPTTEQYRQTIGEEPQNFREQVKNRPEFFHHGDPARPIIPGSSLRGMLRGVLEIVSYGKVERVTDEPLFYRCLDRSSLKDKYIAEFIEKGSHQGHASYRSLAQGGILERNGGQWSIRPCDVYRVEKDDVARALTLATGTDLYTGLDPNDTPQDAYRCRTVRVSSTSRLTYHLHRQLRSNGSYREFYLEYRKSPVLAPGAAGGVDGRLVLTGPMAKRVGPRRVLQNHMAFVFVDSSAASINVSNRKMDQANHPAQITWWQERAFGGRSPSGAFAAGDPVFYLTDPSTRQVYFLGRAQMFRLPYRTNPMELVPEMLCQAKDLDYADALFGWVKKQGKQGSRDRSFAGRVCVGDAVPVGEVEFLDTLVPRILATPKPTAFQKYLTQLSDEPRRLQHYDSGAQDGQAPVIRGHKRYWSQGAVTPGQIREQDPNWLGPDGEVKSDSTQHTRMRPVAAGAEFTFRIWFENLDQRELGALCWALCPVGEENVTYVHQLGMGKPLGLGAVEVTEAKVHLTQRPERYETLFEEGAWATGGECLGDLCDKATTTLRNVTKRFKNHILEVLGQQRLSQLSELDRIKCLLALMRWRTPRPQWVRGETPGNDRRVLPDPLVYDDLPAPRSLSRPAGLQRGDLHNPAAPTTNQPPPTPRKLAPPPAAKAPEQARPALKAGKQNLEVVAVEGRMVTLRLPDGTTFARKWDRYGDPPAVGDPVKVKLRLSTDGTRVEKLDWD